MTLSLRRKFATTALNTLPATLMATSLAVCASMASAEIIDETPVTHRSAEQVATPTPAQPQVQGQPQTSPQGIQEQAQQPAMPYGQDAASTGEPNGDPNMNTDMNTGINPMQSPVTAPSGQPNQPLSEQAPNESPEGTGNPDFADGMSGGPDWWEVTDVSSHLNVRSEPSAQSTVVTTVSNGSALRNQGCEMADGVRWCHIETQSGTSGYVSGQYLKEGVAP